MRLLIHQVAKDLRVLRWLALAWLLLVVVLQAMTVGIAMVPVSPQAAPSLLPTYVIIQASLVGLLGAICVVLVQSDPAVGTTAFWFTRPISAWTLLASKFSLAILLLVGVPVAADLVAMMAGDLSAGAAFSTVPSTLAIQLAWLVPLLALAAVTSNLAQFVCAALGEIFIFVATVFVIRWIRVPPRLGRPPSTGELLAVFLLGLVTLGLAVLVIAYRTRRFRGAAVLTGIAPVAIVVLMYAWPFDFFSWRHDRLAASVAAIGTVAQLEPGGGGDWRLSVGFRLSNVPPRAALAPTGVRAWIDYADGSVALAPAWAQMLPANRPDESAGSEFRALSDAIGVPEVTDPRSRPASRGGFTAVVPRNVYARRQNDSGVLHADVRMLVNQKNGTIVSLRPGQSYQTGDRNGTITSVAAQPDALSVAVTDLTTKVVSGADSGDTVSVVYALRNPRLGIGLLPSDSRGAIGLPPYQAPIPAPAHLAANRLTLRFPWPEQTTSADFLNGAQLVVVESHTVRYAFVHLTMPISMLSALRPISRPMPDNKY